MAAFAAPIIGAAGSLISGLLGASAAEKAAQAQVQGATNGVNQQTQRANDSLSTLSGIYSTDKSAVQPYQQTGTAALGQIGSAVLSGTPSADQVLAQDPGYQFRLDQGQLALQRAAAAGGGLASGGTLKAAEQYGQDYASGEYNNAFNRFLQSNQQRYSQLMGLAGLGTTANGQLIGAGDVYGGQQANVNENAGNQISNLDTEIGNAQASGYIGRANALSGMVGSLTNIGQGLKFPGGGGGGYDSYAGNQAMTNYSLSQLPMMSLGNLG